MTVIHELELLIWEGRERLRMVDQQKEFRKWWTIVNIMLSTAAILNEITGVAA